MDSCRVAANREQVSAGSLYRGLRFETPCERQQIAFASWIAPARVEVGQDPGGAFDAKHMYVGEAGFKDFGF